VSFRGQADLSQRILVAWERLLRTVPPDVDRLDWLSRATGMSFQSLDFVRRVRNDVAHPDTAVSRDRLVRALDLIEEAQRQVDVSRRRPAPRAGTSSANGRARSSPPGRSAPAGPVSARINIVVAYVGSLTCGMLSLCMLLDNRRQVRVHAFQATVLGVLVLAIVAGESFVPPALLTLVAVAWGVTWLVALGRALMGRPVRLPILGRVAERLFGA
jgi:uncharacterized membrane protein